MSGFDDIIYSGHRGTHARVALMYSETGDIWGAANVQAMQNTTAVVAAPPPPGISACACSAPRRLGPPTCDPISTGSRPSRALRRARAVLRRGCSWGRQWVRKFVVGVWWEVAREKLYIY